MFAVIIEATMRSKIFIISTIVLGILAGCNSSSKTYTATDLKGIEDSASYLYGIATAMNLKKDSNINLDVFIAALKEGLDKDSGFAIELTEYQAVDQKFRVAMKEKQDLAEVAKNKPAAESFLTQIAQKPGIQKLNGGILLETIKAGSGDAPGLRDSAQYHLVYSTNTTPNILNTKEQSQYPFPMMNIMDMNFLTSLPDAILKMQEGGEYIVYMPYESAKSFFTDKNSKPGEVSIVKVTDFKIKRGQ